MWAQRARTEMRRGARGVTFIEILMCVTLCGVAILTITAVVSADLVKLSRNQTDLVGLAALRRRVEFRRLQPFNTLPPVSVCTEFANNPADPDFANNADLRSLPFNEGSECVEIFETSTDTRIQRLTIRTSVFEQVVPATDPRIRRFRIVMPIYQDGINRQ